ncbi:MAG TPA: penicillin-binding protein 2 [Chloroflexota bacterium]|nr:penicillin-binding protein 2 [Chloroflexota bacterium]
MRRRRGNPFLKAFFNVLLAVVGGAGLMLLAFRLGLVPTSVLGSAPAQTALSLASTAAPAVAAIEGTPTAAAATPTPGPGSPTPNPASAPTPVPTRPASQDAAKRYLTAWQQQRYPDMYKMLSAGAKQTIAEDRFVSRYQAITVGATINAVEAQLQPGAEPGANETRAEWRYKVTFKTARLGDFAEDNRLPLVWEDNDWKVEWTPSLIFRDLTTDRSVRFIPDDPVRGSIVDRNGQPLAIQGRIVSLGVVPGRVKDMNKVVAELAKFLDMPQDAVRAKLAPAKPDWWVPFRDFPLERQEELTKRFANLDGVLAEQKDGRVYPLGPVAAHVVGFVSPVNQDDLKTLGAKGYEEGDMVGRTGVELWGEDVLAGVRGGKLIITDGTGETIRTVAERPAKNGGTIQLSIDTKVQTAADKVLDRPGSIVMLDPRDNSVLALVSKPTFDPNGFITGFSDAEWKKLADDPNRPFQLRPTMSSYATGSVFKTVTMVAGMEKGGYQPNTQFTCTGQWGVKELNVKKPWGDWKPQGHGKLDLAEGLTESCDIVFYEVGNKLNSIDPNLLADFAHQFGYGQPTGVQGLQETAGIVASPDWKKKTLREEWVPGDAINQAIGQGYLDATPLQVANAYSVLANGGVLRTPLLVKKIIPGDGTPAKEFQAQERGRVAVSGEHLAVVRAAMKKVASSPLGTAYYAFRDYKVPVAAKTGSAENQNPEDNAWFAGYGPADDPKVVVTVMVEGGQHGGTVAAPLGRQAFEIVLGK